MAEDTFEVLVIGGGPAGQSAALYLARFDRRTALFDAGQGRSTWHQVNHNYLGFPGGIPARKLRELGRQQLSEYSQVTILEHRIDQMERDGDLFIAQSQAGTWCGHSVVLCTGVVDHFPHFEGWEEYVGRSMFWCITCDGYGCKGQRVVVGGNNDAAASMALQLSRFTAQITVLTTSYEHEISPEIERRLEQAGIPLIQDRLDRVVGHNGQLEALYTMGGLRLELDQFFSHHGATPQSKLAQDLGVALDQAGYIQTDTEQKTNIPGVFAAGDVTKLYSHQISTAVYEGGQAASAANYYLYPPELKDV